MCHWRQSRILTLWHYLWCLFLDGWFTRWKLGSYAVFGFLWGPAGIKATPPYLNASFCHSTISCCLLSCTNATLSAQNLSVTISYQFCCVLAIKIIMYFWNIYTRVSCELFTQFLLLVDVVSKSFPVRRISTVSVCFCSSSERLVKWGWLECKCCEQYLSS